MVCLQPAPVNLLAFAQTSRIHQVGTAISHSVLLLQNSMFCNQCEPNGSLGCVQWFVMSQGLLGLCCLIETRDRIEIITLTATSFE